MKGGVRRGEGEVTEAVEGRVAGGGEQVSVCTSASTVSQLNLKMHVFLSFWPTVNTTPLFLTPQNEAFPKTVSEQWLCSCPEMLHVLKMQLNT